MTVPEGREGAAVLFTQRYGRQPRGAWRAPGRVNFIGEHTDYNEGFVLPFAIGAGLSAAAAQRDDGVLALTSRQAAGEDVAVPLDSLKPGSVSGWAAYPAGVAWALREAGYPIGGASIAVDSDIPLGAGLSSSAALECAVALTLTELHGLTVPRPQLAAIARRAENEYVGAPTGIMDQSAALLSQAGHALLLDCRSGEADSVPLDPALSGLALAIIDTRARHVITENQRVLEAAALLRRGKVAGIGGLLNESHASLRDDFEISWPEADVAVDAATAAGAVGARMMGGGFGGSVIALLPEDGSAVHQAVCEAFRERGWPEPGFLDAPPSPSARRLR
jgi:galactokinase